MVTTSRWSGRRAGSPGCASSGCGRCTSTRWSAATRPVWGGMAGLGARAASHPRAFTHRERGAVAPHPEQPRASVVRGPDEHGVGSSRAGETHEVGAGDDPDESAVPLDDRRGVIALTSASPPCSRRRPGRQSCPGRSRARAPGEARREVGVSQAAAAPVVGQGPPSRPGLRRRPRRGVAGRSSRKVSTATPRWQTLRTATTVDDITDRTGVPAQVEWRRAPPLGSVWVPRSASDASDDGSRVSPSIP